ncbi:hypothetical protein BYT27DRAFT_7187360 [Phlegmacium glaucopus]|nr:hypothetical protein BYT27DRAFT_7187360 [Phlegmacium glaucopus]
MLRLLACIISGLTTRISLVGQLIFSGSSSATYELDFEAASTVSKWPLRQLPLLLTFINRSYLISSFLTDKQLIGLTRPSRASIAT